MDFFTKKRFVVWTIIILVILNLSTLAMMWFHQLRRYPPPPPSRNESPEQGIHFLEEELKLSKAQVQKFIESRNQHFIRSRVIVGEIQNLRKEIVNEVFSPSPDSSKVKKLANEIGAKQTELEQLLFNHFFELRSICNPDQEVKLKVFFRDLFEVVRPPGPQMPLRGP